MSFIEMLINFKEYLRFIMVCIALLVVIWSIVSFVDKKDRAKNNLDDDLFSKLIRVFTPCLVPILLFYIICVICTSNEEKIYVENVTKTYPLISTTTVNGVEGNLNLSMFDNGSGYITDKMKIYFYIEENNKMRLMSADSNNCEFIASEAEPYVEIIEQYPAIKYNYKNNSFTKLIGLVLPKEWIEKDGDINTSYKLYIPENSVNKYFNLNLIQ